tara:strand:+ start:948 stop:1391 length:444 start_codon:yes stop_codon:yes gene_type:complete
MKQTGRCQCGRINYQFNQNDVLSAHHCHCKDCQRSTGSGKATILYIPTKKLTIEGELKFYESKGSLGTNIRRGFCSNCGSGVMSYAKQMPMLKFLKAGTLDDSSWLKINSSFFSKSSEEWNAPVENIKCFEGNPDMLSSLKNVIKSL